MTDKLTLEKKKLNLENELKLVEQELTSIKNADNLTLEQKFQNAVLEAHRKINSHLKIAQQNLDEAVKVAEEYGIPFGSNIVEFITRTYIPKSFKEKWNELPKKMYEILEDMNLSVNYSEVGWEYWSSSSLTC